MKRKIYKRYKTRKKGGQHYTLSQKSIDGKKKRSKGLRFEFRILSKLKKQYPDTTFRSAGSHSLIDVLVREPNKLRYISARTKKYHSPKELERLKIFDQPYEQVEIWSRPSPKKIKKTIIKRAE